MSCEKKTFLWDEKEDGGEEEKEEERGVFDREVTCMLFSLLLLVVAFFWPFLWAD